MTARLPRAGNVALLCLVCHVLCSSGCTPLPQRIGASAQWLPSPNYNERRPNLVILHHTSNDTAEQALRTLTDARREVSAHYLLSRDGTRYQLVDERYRAWHAGVSRWGTIDDINSVSIGIELDNNGEEPFPDAQIAALIELLGELKARYHIPRANFLGHADVAPGRKADPSRHFPWRTLAQHGFGLWCERPLAPAPAEFDFELGLRALGYSTQDQNAAIRAFKLHFVQDHIDEQTRTHERDLLYCLLSSANTGAP
jgi:N-acetylmuramoyl-L-alanine amidase